ncbi:MAG: carboxypeptidase regulatory-like domain-containing protein [Acidobacteriota bacterium]|nr:carboxypeptidase regulatory-like domain-containing protein [Acidobacteriota bacterium]
MSKKKLFASLCLVALPALAQQFRSTIGGAVTDQQGAAIASIAVVAIQIDTGAHFRTVTSTDGQYNLPFLPPGLYRVEAAVPGFKKYSRSGIQVSANERVPLDIQLELGLASETIEISADASIIETSTASTGQVITSRQIENIPLNGRTPLTLAQLSMGVIPNSDPRFNRPFDNSGPSGFSIGGAPAQTNEILLDGAPDVTGNDRVSYNPPVDVVQQVKVEIFQADAAAGHTGGGTVNQITKSGTNRYHGTLYEFNQTSARVAQFLLKPKRSTASGRPLQSIWRNVGGPGLDSKSISGPRQVILLLRLRRHQGFLSGNDYHHRAHSRRAKRRFLTTSDGRIELSDL